MYSVWVAAFFPILVWLGVLTYLVLRGKEETRRLFPKDGAGDIRDKFQEVLTTVEKVARDNEVLNKNLRAVYREGLSHVQKMEIVRYNPYEDTGGNVSFSLVMLDGRNNGMLLTSLHTRAGTRVYVKTITKGESEMSLSKEEKQVLEKAIAGMENGR